MLSFVFTYEAGVRPGYIMITFRPFHRGSDAALVLLLALVLVPASAQGQPAASVPPPIPGIAGFHQVSGVVALAGNVSPSAMNALAGQGVATIITLRAVDEVDYDGVAAETAARAAGLRWVAAPFIPDAPDASTVDRVLSELDALKTTKTVVFCKTGQRAALIWFARRVLSDGASPELAMAEAAALGLVRADLKAFALSYVAERSAVRPPR